MIEVTFKGNYQMNGVKTINRVITCSADEARTYTQYMTDRRLQEVWIKANYAGAQTGKGFTLTINIFKFRKYVISEIWA